MRDSGIYGSHLNAYGVAPCAIEISTGAKHLRPNDFNGENIRTRRKSVAKYNKKLRYAGLSLVKPWAVAIVNSAFLLDKLFAIRLNSCHHE